MPGLPVVCLMGPTASGKTDVAASLCEEFPVDIISVDSALVYRHMNIGSAKPDADVLQRAPHRLIDIRDPEESYSAGDFVTDAHREIADIHSAGRIPLLAGGTMLYFRSLINGIADMPPRDNAVRDAIEERAARLGWPALHAELQRVDPVSAERIKPNDRQRIQRALEVHEISGRALSEWHGQGSGAGPDLRFLKIALIPEDRKVLHERIGARLDAMFAAGLVDEVRMLMQRPGLSAEHPSMRSVGYRQVWAHLAGQCDEEEARYRSLVATRQLAKRQLTWLRAEADLHRFDPLESDARGPISALMRKWLDE